MKFSGSGIFKHIYDDPNRITKFEERVVITEATSEPEAEKKILAEFKEYAQDGIVFSGEFTLSEIIESKLVIEVASTMRTFQGTDEEYLEKYWYDLQPETCDDNGWKHVWYNQGKGKRACYNCQEIKKRAL